MADARIALGEGLLGETFAQLRGCGDGQRECAVCWTGPLGEPGRVDRVLHPEHLAALGHYEIAAAWLNRTWRSLAREGREIRVQVHSHPREAFHSATDDGYPMIQTAGFLSLVIPDFAQGEVGFEGAHLVVLGEDGAWQERDPAAAFEEIR